VRIVITVLTVDEALQHICAIFREEADLGDITPTERDLMIDGAILLAMNVDDMSRSRGLRTLNPLPSVRQTAAALGLSGTCSPLRS